jgi:hypothetical protein
MSTRFSIADGLAVMALLLAGVAAATGFLVSGLYRRARFGRSNSDTTAA